MVNGIYFCAKIKQSTAVTFQRAGWETPLFHQPGPGDLGPELWALGLRHDLAGDRSHCLLGCQALFPFDEEEELGVNDLPAMV